MDVADASFHWNYMIITLINKSFIFMDEELIGFWLGIEELNVEGFLAFSGIAGEF